MSRLTTSLCASLVALLLALGFVSWLNSWNDPTRTVRVPGKITIGRDTTYVTEPLDDAGYVNYVAALNERLSKGITAKSNANVLLWQAFGPHPGGAILFPEFFQALGIDSPPEKGDYFVPIATFWQETLKADTEGGAGTDFEKLGETFVIVSRQPWTPKEYPNIVKWLTANEKPLTLIAEATKREQYYNPLIPQADGKPQAGLVESLLPTIASCYEVANALALGLCCVRLGAMSMVPGKTCSHAIDLADWSLMAVWRRKCRPASASIGSPPLPTSLFSNILNQAPNRLKAT